MNTTYDLINQKASRESCKCFYWALVCHVSLGCTLNLLFSFERIVKLSKLASLPFQNLFWQLTLQHPDVMRSFQLGDEGYTMYAYRSFVILFISNLVFYMPFTRVFQLVRTSRVCPKLVNRCQI